MKFGIHTQAFAEAEADAVEWIAEFFDGSSGLRCYVPNPSAIQVHLDTLAVHVLGYLNDVSLGEYLTVQRVLEGDDLCGSSILGVR